MRTADISPGKTYLVRVPERECLVYLGADIEARVIRAGFHYEVETVTGSAVRGAPFVRHSQSQYPQGVEIEWDRQEVWSNKRGRGKEHVAAGRAIVNARAVEFEVKA